MKLKIRRMNGENFTVLYDKADHELLSKYRWSVAFCGKQVYAATRSDACKHQYMHRILMCPQKGLVVDHVNGNGLDNRRCNLRAIEHRINLMRPPSIKKEYKGVTFVRRKYPLSKPWAACFYKDHIGYFKTAEEAALAYNLKAMAFIEEHGIDIHINKIKEK